MAVPYARNQYLKTQVETATKEQLVVMLFDGIVRFTEQARKAINEGNLEDSHHALMRAQAIIMELICTIDKDKGGDIANSMMSLHAYAFNCLIVCNMKKDVSKIDEVQKIYRELRDAWVGAMDTLGIGPTSGKAAPATPAAPAAKAPAAPAPAKPAAVPSAVKPGIPNVNASAAPASTLVAGQTRLAAPASTPAPAPAAAPKSAGYGMGRTAALGAVRPAAAAASAAVTPSAAKQSAMLNAYGAGARSIA